jgi:hypothetical protein
MLIICHPKLISFLTQTQFYLLNDLRVFSLAVLIAFIPWFTYAYQIVDLRDNQMQLSTKSSSEVALELLIARNYAEYIYDPSKQKTEEGLITNQFFTLTELL